MNQYNTIDSFLEDWKNKAREYYLSRLDEYSIVREKYTKALNEYTDNDAKSPYKENLNVVYNEFNDYQKNPPYSKLVFKIVDNMYYDRKLNRPCPLENILDKEVANKKATFIARIEKKAGTIKNVDLNIGVDGSINGKVVGNKNTVSVYSIIAGGWNIQIAHYRVLINIIKFNKESKYESRA